ncbi:hypothetical protein [Fodinibius sediminis]|uniref:Uncharacterized protein n=1 Tax=Fodinibius sediminis TaxID=1214077 RepID=A0A521DIF9_9BACT|nr:hypothetical protein [Fodinibius sediminis]SMO71497.1 hypothetical protein SAMN06265218_110104 [Fodinibius sediminis]
MDIRSSRQEANLVQEQEIVQMGGRSSRPASPKILVEVPDDDIIEGRAINLDAALSLNEPLEMPPLLEKRMRKISLSLCSIWPK